VNLTVEAGRLGRMRNVNGVVMKADKPLFIAADLGAFLPFRELSAVAQKKPVAVSMAELFGARKSQCRTRVLTAAY